MTKSKTLRSFLAVFAAFFLLCSCVTEEGGGTLSTASSAGETQADMRTPDQRFSVREGVIVLGKWWTFFGDSTLNMLVERALSRDGYRVEARDRLQDARRIHLQQDGKTGDENLHMPTFDASFERNLFSSGAGLDDGAFDDVSLSLIGEICKEYAAYRSYEKKALEAEGYLKAEKKILALSRTREGQNVPFNIDVKDTEKRIALIREKISGYLQQADQTRLVLGVLTGASPEEIFKLVTKAKPPLGADVMPALASPVQALAKRPDIRAARDRFSVKTRYTESVTDHLFPPLSLNRFYGIKDNVFADPSFQWNIELGKAVTRVDFTHVESRIDTDHAVHEQAYRDLKLTVLQAVMDVEGKLVAYAQAQAGLAEAQKILADAQQAFEGESLNYKNGTGSLKSVLEEQEHLNAANTDILTAEYMRVSALIALYKALGVY